MNDIIFFIGFKNISALVQGCVCFDSRICLLRFNDTTSQVQGYTFVEVMTSVGSSAEPSQQVCSL